ncbi:hypothetical protein DVS77_10365 [Mycolicibacterium moriokaense]|nr:hypothetical protein DVS77_10365 [Mycolicibacterium moriokaense]
MARVSPGWLVAFCAAVLAVAVWLPWLTTSAAGGGRANAVGGVVGTLTLPPHFGAGQLIALLASALIVAGAMAARGLSARVASSAALGISVLIAALTMWYYRLYIHPPVAAGYGFYIGAAATAVAIGLSVWTMVAAWAAAGRQP